MNIGRHLAVIGGLAVLVFAARAAQALEPESLQCAGHLVVLGEPTQAVFQECGAPSTSSHHAANYRGRRGTVDTWTYRRSGSFDRVLTFQDGYLSWIAIPGAP
ncbi:MAG: DUF2845 domain-containing protein [Polyangiaceae bacterium]